jgi:6-phosphogluconate dehydrogenase
MTEQLHEIGMIGLGVMGRSLVLNMADHGFGVAGYDKDLAKGKDLLREGAGKPVAAAENYESFVAMLKPPRVVMLLVAPASVVDLVLNDLLPHLQPDDLVIDAGNSYFKDTDRRGKVCGEKGVRFFGMGVSGGEAGARHGPSMMPGGPKDGYECPAAPRTATSGCGPSSNPSPPRSTANRASPGSATARPDTTSRWCTTASSTA